eukprot:3369037-Rhodomonas_salina.2
MGEDEGGHRQIHADYGRQLPRKLSACSALGALHVGPRICTSFLFCAADQQAGDRMLLHTAARIWFLTAEPEIDGTSGYQGPARRADAPGVCEAVEKPQTACTTDVEAVRLPGQSFNPDAEFMTLVLRLHAVRKSDACVTRLLVSAGSFLHQAGERSPAQGCGRAKVRADSVQRGQGRRAQRRPEPHRERARGRADRPRPPQERRQREPQPLCLRVQQFLRHVLPRVFHLCFVLRARIAPSGRRYCLATTVSSVCSFI